MRIYLFVLAILTTGLQLSAQPILRTGDLFPNIVLRPLVNAPVPSLDIRGETIKEKFLLLNFWGTWCSPCIPEMDSLAVLQERNKGLIRVIGISNEPVERLQKYLTRKPSSLWLASDTLGNLYQQFALNYVGQSAIINRDGRIVAIVKTDSVNQLMIDRLLKGEAIYSSAETGRKDDMEKDIFAVDSSMDAQLSWSSYRAGTPTMSKRYTGSAFEGRRISYFNICPDNIYRDIFHVSYNQVEYEGGKKGYCRWDEKNSLVCVDLLVRPQQKDSLMAQLRQVMEKFSPVKARLRRKVIPVYILSRLPGTPEWKTSAAQASMSFSGRGFEGKAITMEGFSDYVANELETPVIDETGLKGRYDIHTENVLRTKDDMLAALKKLGLGVVKTEREMDIVVIYKE